MHLISPVTIGSTAYCTNKGGTGHTAGRLWRTESILSGGAALVTSESGDAWTLYSYSTNYDGTVKFGTCCIKTVKLRFYIDVDGVGSPPTANYPTVTIKLNGITIWSYTKTFLAGPEDAQPNAIYEDVLIDLAAGTVSADAIRGANNTGGTPGAVHTSGIGTATGFTASRDRPCGNVWEINAATPNEPDSTVSAIVAVLDVT